VSISIRLQPRREASVGLQLAVLALSLLAGFIAVGLVFVVKGVNPFFALWKILAGSFGSLYGISETITKAIPLILIGAGLTLAFRAKFWNIGAESQLLIGAIFATWIGLNLGARLPAWLVVPLIFLAGLPALFKVRFGVNEVISTLMLNYVAAEFLTLLIVGPWKGATQQGFPYTDDLPASAALPLIPGTRIHYLTLLVALACTVLLFFLIYSTKFGYELRVVGENPEAARYAGIDFLRTTAGQVESSGGDHLGIVFRGDFGRRRRHPDFLGSARGDGARVQRDSSLLPDHGRYLHQQPDRGFAAGEGLGYGKYYHLDTYTHLDRRNSAAPRHSGGNRHRTFRSTESRDRGYDGRRSHVGFHRDSDHG
jgi:simple sugar transport system permease protein